MDAVTLTVEGGIAHLELSRPDAGNAVDLPLARDLREAVLACERNAAVRAVLLSGRGPAFCVGGDLRAFAAEADLPGHLREVTTHLHAALVGLARLDAPVVVAVHGSAAGAGLGLACSGDVVLAATSTRFLVAYTKVGLNPDGGSSWFLPRLVGLRRAQELTLLNPVIGAQDAMRMGLVTRVVADDRLGDEASAVAAALAAGPTAALGEAKRLLRSSLDHPLEVHLEAEASALVRSAAGADAHEGVEAFLAKRPPRFTGGRGPSPDATAATPS